MLREGYTTGSAVTAAAVAAVRALAGLPAVSRAAISSPSGVLSIPVASTTVATGYARASVVKDAGDDPDCTHGIALEAEASRDPLEGTPLTLSERFRCVTGAGIGIVTAEGLPVPKGEPAVNPVPRRMLRENVERVLDEAGVQGMVHLRLSVPDGASIARKTLNPRLGIVGGISILGTSGVVRPISTEAFTASIDIALDVAAASGRDAVLCFGRQSEIAVRRILTLRDEAFVMMGDHLGHAVAAAKARGLAVSVAGQPAKILKACSGIDDTHVRAGVFDPADTRKLLRAIGMGAKAAAVLSRARTARHMYDIAVESGIGDLWQKAARYLARERGIRVFVFDYDGNEIARA